MVWNRETFVVNERGRRDDGTDVEDRYTVYEFVPRDDTPPRRVVREETVPQKLRR
jgi:hypothetical protein